MFITLLLKKNSHKGKKQSLAISIMKSKVTCPYKSFNTSMIHLIIFNLSTLLSKDPSYVVTKTYITKYDSDLLYVIKL